MTRRSWLQPPAKQRALITVIAALTAAALLLSVAQGAAAAAQTQQGKVVSYVYKLNYRGEAEVTVIVNATGLEKVSVKLERGYVRGSLTAYSENGTPLFCNVSDDVATVYTYNLTKTAIVEYLAVLGNVSNEVLVNVTIHPQTKASVFLPKGTAITYVSGNPDIEFMNGTIALIYRHGGTYKIDYVIIPPATKTTSATTTATLPPHSTATSKQTTTSALTATTTATTTHTTHGTSTPFSTASVKTTTTSTPATHSQVTTASPPKTPAKTPARQAPIPNPYVWGGVAAACAAGAVAAYAAYRVARRRAGGVGDVEIASGLDDRDMMILETLSGGELSLSEIARRVGLNKSVVWRRVNRMMREGYLERRVVKGRTLYRLTVKGLKAVTSGGKGENLGG